VAGRSAIHGTHEWRLSSDERKNQAESELKFAVARLRTNAPTAAAGASQSAPVGFALAEVMRHWRRLRGQYALAGSPNRVP
jgi:hypothetical protein